VNFPKSVDRVTISLWTVHTLIFYVFWITCAASDKTVEKGFWLTMLIWSVFLTVILVIYGIANSQMDHAWKAQVVLAVAFMAISSVSVHVTLTNDQQILGDCAVYERCHWWDEGLAAPKHARHIGLASTLIHVPTPDVPGMESASVSSTLGGAYALPVTQVGSVLRKCL
jgi:hypothetical protein